MLYTLYTLSPRQPPATSRANVNLTTNATTVRRQQLRNERIRRQARASSQFPAERNTTETLRCPNLVCLIAQQRPRTVKIWTHPSPRDASAPSCSSSHPGAVARRALRMSPLTSNPHTMIPTTPTRVCRTFRARAGAQHLLPPQHETAPWLLYGTICSLPYLRRLRW